MGKRRSFDDDLVATLLASLDPAAGMKTLLADADRFVDGLTFSTRLQRYRAIAMRVAIEHRRYVIVAHL